MKYKDIERVQLPLIGAILIIVFAALTYWAGFPREKFSLFVLGATLVIGGMALYGLLTWHLMLRPLPAGVKAPELSLQPSPIRRLQAVLLTIAGMGIVIGGFWDEVWHRSFGFPFGPDLFWRPHILIYLGLLTPPALAAYSLYRLFKHGRGNLQQRLRADPPSALLILAGGFLMYTVPADPIWHTIYGEDISAWSLPHILLLFSVTLMMLLAVHLQLTTLPERKWSSLRGIRAAELLVIFGLAFALLLQMQVLATDWENGNPMLTQRPEWLLPVIFAALAALMGGFSNRSLRRWGAATVMGATALAIRYGLIQAFDYPAITIQTWLPILPPLLASDLWAAIRENRLKGKQSTGWLNYAGEGIAVLAGMTASLILINATFSYPKISWFSAAEMALASLLAGFLGSWISGWLSGSFSRKSGNQEENASIQNRLLQLVPATVFSMVVAFIAFFITTATPPA